MRCVRAYSSHSLFNESDREAESVWKSRTFSFVDGALSHAKLFCGSGQKRAHFRRHPMKVLKDPICRIPLLLFLISEQLSVTDWLTFQLRHALKRLPKFATC